MKRRVVITGMGVVTPLGCRVDELWNLFGPRAFLKTPPENSGFLNIVVSFRNPLDQVNPVR